MFFSTLRSISSKGEEVYASGDTVKIDSRPIIYGKALYFIKKSNVKELGSVIYVKLPEEV